MSLGIRKDEILSILYFPIFLIKKISNLFQKKEKDIVKDSNINNVSLRDEKFEENFAKD